MPAQIMHGIVIITVIQKYGLQNQTAWVQILTHQLWDLDKLFHLSTYILSIFYLPTYLLGLIIPFCKMEMPPASKRVLMKIR